MNDLRSFLRYLVPGLGVVAELILLIVLSGGAGDLQASIEGLKDSGTALAALGISVLMVMGYLLGMLHHTTYSVCDLYAAVDLRGVMNRLVKTGRLKLISQCDPNETIERSLSRSGAWQGFTTLWHTRKADSKALESATPRAESLMDLVHGAGTSFFSCCLAVSLAFVYLLHTKSGLAFRLAVITGLPIATLLLFFHWKSYKALGKIAQGYSEQVLFLDLSRDVSASPLHVHTGDLD